MERNVKQFVNPERSLLKLVTLFICIGILDKKTVSYWVKSSVKMSSEFDIQILLLMMNLKRDGFKDSAEMREWFSKTHEPKPNDFFDIISW